MMTAHTEMITEAEIHRRLQDIADKHPVEYESLHRQRTQLREFCCPSHLIDGLAGHDYGKRRMLEEADTLLWLAGAY